MSAPSGGPPAPIPPKKDDDEDEKNMDKLTARERYELTKPDSFPALLQLMEEN